MKINVFADVATVERTRFVTPKYLRELFPVQSLHSRPHTMPRIQYLILRLLCWEIAVEH